jgi:hypothetical protein
MQLHRGPSPALARRQPFHVVHPLAQVNETEQADENNEENQIQGVKPERTNYPKVLEES